MQIIRCTEPSHLGELNSLLPKDKKCAVALGFFDGMHTAHRALISKAKEIADGKNLFLAVFTFFGESKSFKSSSPRIFSDEDRLAIFEECGTDIVVIGEFSLFSGMSREEFVRDFLIKQLNADTAVCGYNFRFGKGASGNSELLSELMAECGGNAFVMDDFIYEGRSVSSSLIRTLIAEGRPREAKELLGAPFFISGEVAHGMGLGRKLGFPTVNIALTDGLIIPKNGVYASVLRSGEHILPAITNIGACPTFGEREVHTESFILDFDGNLYDTDARIYLIDYLRDERKFEDEKELILQINIDKNRAIQLFKEISWQEIGLK